MSDEKVNQETELMQRIQAKEQTALAALYDQFGGMVFGVAMHTLQNQILAEEVTQDTFMKVWKQAYRWDQNKGTLATWLLTITRYTAIDRLRKEKRQAPSTMIDLDDILNIKEHSNVVDQAEWQTRELLKDLIQKLSPEQIEAIELAFFYGMSHTEIADYLQQPLGTIKSRIRDGLQTLKGLWLRYAE